MTAACPIFGDHSYLHMASEAAFGVLDGLPAYVYHPVISYGMVAVPEMRQPMPFTGLVEEFDNQIVHESVSGQLTAALYGWRNAGGTISLAQYIMEWAFGDPNTVCGLPSKTIEWAEGPNIANKRTLGTTVGGATLAGGDDNGAAITLALDLMGANEDPVTSAQAVPAGLSSLSEFLFSRATFKIVASGGALAVQPIKSFSWGLNRSLSPVFNGSFNPSYFRPAKPTHTFQISVEKADGTWDAIRRLQTPANYHCELTLKGLHQGTGGVGTNFATCVIDIPKMSFRGAGENYVRNGVLVQNLSFVPMKPNTIDASFTMVWGEAA